MKTELDTPCDVDAKALLSVLGFLTRIGNPTPDNRRV